MSEYGEVDSAHDKRVRRIFYLATTLVIMSLIIWVGAVWLESGKMGLTGLIVFVPSGITMLCCALSLRWID